VHGSSGGGIATYFVRPSYQTITPPNEKVFGNIPTTPMRVVPDLSMNADSTTGIIVYFVGTPFNNCVNDCRGGGTSASSPLMAGAVALAAQRIGGGQVGGINPFIYNNFIGAPWLYDVTTGYNGASARVGWDYVTGLGSLKDVNAFINALVPPLLEVKLQDDYGPLDVTTPHSLSYALTNVQPYQTIVFNLPAGKIITLHGQLPQVKPFTRINGGNCTQPVILDGSGLPAGTIGLQLQGNVQIFNLKLINFKNVFGGIKTVGQNNRLSCVSVNKLN
jgi:hypothetical protein